MSRPSCVDCQGSRRQGKLLKCLHTVCSGCLQQHITCTGTVLCPKCKQPTPAPAPGTTQLQSLPDSYVTLPHPSGEMSRSLSYADVAGGHLDPKPCGECGHADSEWHCADCGRDLCEHCSSIISHTGHAITEKTTLPPPPSFDKEAEEEVIPNGPCPLHPSYTIGHVCSNCDKLLCEQCRTVGQHQHPGEEVDVSEAAQAVAREIREKRATATDAGADQTLQTTVSGVAAAIEQVDAQKNAAAARITRFFDDIVEQVTKRKEALLSELDQLYTEKHDPLMQQNARLQEVMATSEAIGQLLDAKQSNSNFVKMSAWLDAAMDTQVLAVESNREPCTISELKFYNSHGDELSTLIAKAGHVTDSIINAVGSSLSGSIVARSNKTAKFFLTVLGNDGKPLRAKEANQAQLKVLVQTPSDDTLPCSIVDQPGDNKSSLLATFVPLSDGKHMVSAMASHSHLKGSPMSFNVNTGDSFDIAESHRALRFFNNSTTVENQTGGWECAVGEDTYAEDSHEFTVRVDALGPHTYVTLGVTAALHPAIDQQPWDDIIGWPGYIVGQGRADGSGLGQPWRAGDIIRFMLDCDDETLCAHHERTNSEASLIDARLGTGNVRLMVGTCDRKDRVTIL